MSFYTQEESKFKDAYPKAFWAIEQAFKDEHLDKSNFYLGECVAKSVKPSSEELEVYYINSTNEAASMWFDIHVNNGTVVDIESSYGEDP